MHRIPLPLPNDGLKSVNVYAIDDGDRVVLVDAGWALPEAQQALADGLALIGRELGDVSAFYVTHVHRDHYTQAVALRRVFGGQVFLGEGERACLGLIRDMPAEHPDVARMHEAGAPGLGRVMAEWSARGSDIELSDWQDPDVWLPNGVELPLSTRTLRAIATPGHTRGHLVFHDAAHRVLFAGDHVLPHITPSIGVELGRPRSPLRHYLSSLALVRAMPDAQLLPAHGPVTASVHDRVDELLTHHAERLAATQEAVGRGASTAFEAARAITWTRRARSFDDLDTFNQILAVHETMAHLRVLVERGQLIETADDEHVLRFAAAGAVTP